MSFFRLITRAIVPGMFSYSIGELLFQYLRPFLSVVFEPPGGTPSNIQRSFELFLARTFHITFLFLPVTLAIFTATWILNDYVVVSYRTKAEEYSDPVKVGQWISGLLSGFSLFAFPLAFLDRFIFNPVQRYSWAEVADTIPVVLWTMANVLIVFLAYVLPILIVYETGKAIIAKYFYKVATRLNVENTSILLSKNPTILSTKEDTILIDNREVE